MFRSYSDYLDEIIILTGVMEGTGGDKPLLMEYLKLIQEQAEAVSYSNKRITLLIRYDGASVSQAQALYNHVQLLLDMKGGLSVDVIFLPTNTARLEDKLPGASFGPGPASYDNGGVKNGLDLVSRTSAQRGLYEWELNGKTAPYDPFAASGRWGKHVEVVATDNSMLRWRLTRCHQLLIIPHAHLVGAKDFISLREAGLSEKAEICLISFLERHSPSLIEADTLPSSINERITFVDNAVGVARIFPRSPELEPQLTAAKMLLEQIGIGLSTQLSPCYMNYEKDALMCNPKFSDYVQLVKYEISPCTQQKSILAMGAKNNSDVNYLIGIAQVNGLSYRLFEVLDGEHLVAKYSSDIKETELCIVKGIVPQQTLHQLFAYGYKSGGIVGATGEASALEAMYKLKLPIFYQCASWMQEFQQGLLASIPTQYNELCQWYQCQSALAAIHKKDPSILATNILADMKGLCTEKLKIQSEYFSHEILHPAAVRGVNIARDVANCVVRGEPVLSLSNKEDVVGMVRQGIFVAPKTKVLGHDQQVNPLGQRSTHDANSTKVGAFPFGCGASPLLAHQETRVASTKGNRQSMLW
jgi:hypothetical protein